MYENAIFVKETKFPNKCDFCKEWIPAKSPSYWDKITKKNWHKNCYEENVKGKPQYAMEQPKNVAVKAYPTEKLGKPTKDPTTEQWLKEAKDEMQQAGYIAGADSPVLAALIEGKATLWATEKIHKDTARKNGWKDD